MSSHRLYQAYISGTIWFLMSFNDFLFSMGGKAWSPYLIKELWGPCLLVSTKPSGPYLNSLHYVVPEDSMAYTNYRGRKPCRELHSIMIVRDQDKSRCGHDSKTKIGNTNDNILARHQMVRTKRRLNSLTPSMSWSLYMSCDFYISTYTLY